MYRILICVFEIVLRPSGYCIYHLFNTLKLYNLPTECIPVFLIVVAINSVSLSLRILTGWPL